MSGGVYATPGLRRDRILTDSSGLLTWSFDPPFKAGVIPIVAGIAETSGGDMVNVQVVGTPTNTSCQMQVNRANFSVVALLGLTILSIPASVGVTPVNVFAMERQ